MENIKSKQKEYLLSSVKNSLKLLRSFSMDQPEQGVRDLAKSLGLAKSTVHRLMLTLASEGFLKKDHDTQKYRLGSSVLALGTIYTQNLDIYRESLSPIRDLVEKVQETAHLSVLERTELVYLAKVESKHPVRMLCYTGKYNPAHITGCGKAILAYQNQDLIEDVIAKGLPQFTKNTITEPDEFRKHLKEIKDRGYALNMEEYVEDGVSIAAPIRDYTGEVIAAVDISGLYNRIMRRDISFYAKKS